MFGQPGSDGRSFVGGQVVADQVDVQLGWDNRVDTDEELLELHCPLLAAQFGDYRAVGDVERREQARHAVPGVVVGTPFHQRCAAARGSASLGRRVELRARMRVVLVRFPSLRSRQGTAAQLGWSDHRLWTVGQTRYSSRGGGADLEVGPAQLVFDLL
jgi:hypothetical protein